MRLVKIPIVIGNFRRSRPCAGGEFKNRAIAGAQVVIPINVLEK